MIDKAPVMVLDEHGRTENGFGGGLKTFDFELDVPGGPVHFEVHVAQRPANLSDLVPLARMISARLSLATMNNLRRDGACVPCRKGCPACCTYMVPLSVPEAFRLWDDVSDLPADQRGSVYESCVAAAQKILEAVPQDLAGNEPTQTDSLHISRLGGWYAGLRLPCPFLSDGLCTSYQDRPLACREHLVTGSAAPCRGEGPAEPSVVPLPVSVLECLGQLTAELEQSELEAVMLPLALPWAKENIERSRQTWPATAMVERFIEILRETTNDGRQRTDDGRRREKRLSIADWRLPI